MGTGLRKFGGVLLMIPGVILVLTGIMGFFVTLANWADDPNLLPGPVRLLIAIALLLVGWLSFRTGRRILRRAKADGEPDAAHPAGPSRDGRTGLEIETGYPALAFLLAFCTPIISIDGTPNERPWGTHFFDLEPGRHDVRVFFPYLWMKECGGNSIAIEVNEGAVAKVKYFMPPLIFLKGSIKSVA